MGKHCPCIVRDCFHEWRDTTHGIRDTCGKICETSTLQVTQSASVEDLGVMSDFRLAMQILCNHKTSRGLHSTDLNEILDKSLF